MICNDLLEVFQSPPMHSEPDAGTVDPFTTAELAAIARYNDDTAAIDYCLDGIAADAGYFTGVEADYGHEAAISYIKAHLGWVREWFEALDSLDADLRGVGDRLSNAADRLLSHEMRNLLQARDKVRVAALHCLIGDAGPEPATEEYGVVMLSNGYVHV